MSVVTSLERLDQDQCAGLLAAGVYGRLVLLADGRPEIVPVNYTTHAGAAWVRTSPGSLLDRYADGAALLLEVDHVDHERAHGWSVVARGRGERVSDEELRSADLHFPGPPRWVRHDDAAWVRLRWDELTGRRTGSGWDLTHGLPVRRASR
ncbi:MULTISPECIES: pyridoxamine 5'-phosphate oxidase family protein [unclassified Nocardioides]|uniref:pyridoxamine 5'-phosphate oxidase family protein n=1 Tax=unclassified Nocardioides TaxID=2615069 RepID=UPI000702F1B7|nr:MULTISPECIES: pyridoxamine 5'-phosphate oxidase family protein [unclassified Nocardioides]KRC50289.1 hypothetical protein ASE19_16980 [Nocardioides sp. Root79]KRC75757.1 hypothetical protein ASE20_23000 [Nocardioides sp. Root240]